MSNSYIHWIDEMAVEEMTRPPMEINMVNLKLISWEKWKVCIQYKNFGIKIANLTWGIIQKYIEKNDYYMSGIANVSKNMQREIFLKFPYMDIESNKYMWAKFNHCILLLGKED